MYQLFIAHKKKVNYAVGEDEHVVRHNNTIREEGWSTFNN
jgi:hypothetical protein